MMNWVGSVRAGQADGDLLGKWLLGVTAYSHLCLQQPIPRPMRQRAQLSPSSLLLCLSNKEKVRDLKQEIRVIWRGSPQGSSPEQACYCSRRPRRL